MYMFILQYILNYPKLQSVIRNKYGIQQKIKNRK